jgi:hypothetical protein
MKSVLSRPGPRVVALFSTLAALFLVGIVVVVGRETAGSIREEARTGAERTAQVFTRLSLEVEEYSNGAVTEEGIEDVEHNVKLSEGVAGVVLWGGDGRPIATIGRAGHEVERAASASLPAAAFRGEISSKVVRVRQGGDMLSVSVPVVLPGQVVPSGDRTPR